VAAYLRCCGTVNNQMKKGLLLSLSVIFFKSVNIWQSYKQEQFVQFMHFFDFYQCGGQAHTFSVVSSIYRTGWQGCRYGMYHRNVRLINRHIRPKIDGWTYRYAPKIETGRRKLTSKKCLGVFASSRSLNESPDLLVYKCVNK